MLSLYRPLKFHGSLRSPDIASPPAKPVTMFAVGGGGGVSQLNDAWLFGLT